MNLHIPKLPKKAIPDWGLDPSMLVIGVEEEKFLLNIDGSTPTVNQVKSLLESLENEGFELRQTDNDGRPLALGKEYDEGYLSLKMDSYTNIIEIALPPFQTPTQIKNTLVEAWAKIESGAKQNSLLLSSKKSVSLHQKEEYMPNYSRASWMENRNLAFENKFKSIISANRFLSKIISSQFHFNIKKSMLKFLPELYSYDYLVPLLYSNSTLNGYHCLRDLIWFNVFPDNYVLFALPKIIPNSEEKYTNLIDSILDYKKDYSFIAPRKSGSLEFRSTCSQNSVESTLEIIALRMLIIIASQSNSKKINIETIRDHFISVCETGKADLQLLTSDYKNLESALDKLPKAWVEYGKNSLKSLLKTMQQ